MEDVTLEVKRMVIARVCTMHTREGKRLVRANSNLV